MKDKKVITKIEKMPVEEKLKLLSETDRAYIRGYIDRALTEQPIMQQRFKQCASYESGSAGSKKLKSRVRDTQ